MDVPLLMTATMAQDRIIHITDLYHHHLRLDIQGHLDRRYLPDHQGRRPDRYLVRYHRGRRLEFARISAVYAEIQTNNVKL